MEEEKQIVLARFIAVLILGLISLLGIKAVWWGIYWLFWASQQ